MSRHPARPVSRGSVSAARHWLRVGNRLPDIDVAEWSFWLTQHYLAMWRTDGSVVRLQCALDYLLETHEALRVVDGSRSVRRRAARLRRRLRAMQQELLGRPDIKVTTVRPVPQ